MKSRVRDIPYSQLFELNLIIVKLEMDMALIIFCVLVPVKQTRVTKAGTTEFEK
jgi:hypothetical protein